MDTGRIQQIYTLWWYSGTQEKVFHYLKAKGIIFATIKVIITGREQQGIASLIYGNPGPKDEVIIPDPYFVLYEYQLILLGAKPVYVDTYPDFSLKEDALRKALTNKTKAILINSPNNPTGVVYSRQERKWWRGLPGEEPLYPLG